MTARPSLLLAILFGLCSLQAGFTAPLPQADGFRGIWYFNQPSKDEYKYKYSGGMATYPQQHIPIAIYCKEVNKTFFVYGGTTAVKPGDKQELLHMVAYFDHTTGKVSRPRILLNKHTDDAHDNPTLAIDAKGYLWIFSSSHGTSRPSYISRSVKPYDITEFEEVLKTNFSYTQPWYMPGQGFVFLHTRYGGGKSLGIKAQRTLFVQTSKDGRTWDTPYMLAGIVQGDYQISWPHGNRLATAFDFHPHPLGLNGRANIYYAETTDGKNWRTVDGHALKLPITETNSPALIYDSRKDKELVYLKDLNYDATGHPVILFLTSKGYEPGPQNNPRTWKTTRWTGEDWVTHPMTTSLNNYDHGSLYIEADGTWRVIAPTEKGPQPYNPGGEMALWLSHDQGVTWQKVRQLTHDSPRNHTYARRPLHAAPEFYALWADGNARQPSESYLYFTDKSGDHVWRLPAKMDTDEAQPEVVFDYH